MQQRSSACSKCGLSKEGHPSAFTRRGNYADGTPQYLSYCKACQAVCDATPERLEARRKTKEARRRAAGVPRLGEKPSCAQGHPRTPENLSGGDCKTCARERTEAKRRALGIQPRQLGLNWACSHDPETNMRYAKGRPKGCKICHREKELEAGRYNPERVRAYAQANRDKINARLRAWRPVNRPDVTGFHKGGPEAIEYAKIIEHDPCVYCGRPGVAKDHIVPVSAGGTGEWSNLAPICRSCNSSKNNKDVLRFMLRRLDRAA